jgi:hypothetical protein
MRVFHVAIPTSLDVLSVVRGRMVVVELWPRQHCLSEMLCQNQKLGKKNNGGKDPDCPALCTFLLIASIPRLSLSFLFPRTSSLFVLQAPSRQSSRHALPFTGLLNRHLSFVPSIYHVT